jgi:hypothetical protein
MKTIFIKPIGKNLTGSSKRHNKQRKEENMEPTPRVYVRSFNSKKENQEAFYAQRTKDKGYRIFKGGVKPNWPQLNSLCLLAG